MMHLFISLQNTLALVSKFVIYYIFVCAFIECPSFEILFVHLIKLSFVFVEYESCYVQLPPLSLLILLEYAKKITKGYDSHFNTDPLL
jgi:hypothetical protein